MRALVSHQPDMPAHTTLTERELDALLAHCARTGFILKDSMTALLHGSTNTRSTANVQKCIEKILNDHTGGRGLELFPKNFRKMKPPSTALLHVEDYKGMMQHCHDKCTDDISADQVLQVLGMLYQLWEHCKLTRGCDLCHCCNLYKPHSQGPPWEKALKTRRNSSNGECIKGVMATNYR
jgi:hypothetical protein